MLLLFAAAAAAAAQLSSDESTQEDHSVSDETWSSAPGKISLGDDRSRDRLLGRRSIPGRESRHLLSLLLSLLVYLLLSLLLFCIL